ATAAEREDRERDWVRWSVSSTYFLSWIKVAITRAIALLDDELVARYGTMDWLLPEKVITPYIVAAFDYCVPHPVYLLYPFPEDRGPDFNFRSPGWSAVHEKRGQARARILSELQTQLDERLDQVENELEKDGKERVPRKVAVEHFDWLALYQVK